MANTIPIPKQFQIFGQTVKVRADNRLLVNEDALGVARFLMNEIHLLPSLDGIPRTQEQLEKTYLHELVHWMFYYTFKDTDNADLIVDEFVVDNIANLLHQVLKTSKY